MLLSSSVLATHTSSPSATWRPLRSASFRLRIRSIGPRGAVQPHGQRDILFLSVLMQQAGSVTGGGHLQGTGDLVHGDAVDGGFFRVDRQAVLGLIVLHVPIDVDHALGLPEQIAY